MAYQYNLKEMHPVSKIELVDKLGIRFWYSGENSDDLPMQRQDSEDPKQQWEPEMRPLLDDSKTIGLFHIDEEECIKHINRRIANYILDDYDKVADTCPVEVEKLYHEKIDEFYSWFWERRTERDSTLFGRFLGHIQSIRQKLQPPPTWYSLKEAAVYSRTGVTKLRELIDEGKLKSRRLDDAKKTSTILIHRKDLDAVILFDRSSGLSKREQDQLKAYQA
ncbi:MAG: helix-turn-helix domain-containing protein [Candidatus Brocadiales bacterium]|nr:helix-turn-helix domain-containing protein [Candidatus Brocadiales bacterium]